jgi:hypothetical protein
VISLPRSWKLGAPITGAPFSGRNELQLRPHADGGHVLIKRAPAPAAALAREAAVLVSLSRPALQFRVPRLHGFSARHGALAIGWVPRAQSLYALHLRRRALPTALGQTLGQSIASLHASPVGDLDHSHASGELVGCLAWPSVAWYATLNPASLALLSAVQAEPGAYSALVALAEAARGAHGLQPVHGDFRHANLLRAGQQWVFVDWEMGGLSDAAVDVGSAVAEAINAMVAPRSSEEQLTRGSTRQWLEAFWRGYRKGAPVEKGFAERALQWAGEGLLRRVYSEAHYEGRFDASSKRVIEAALELLTRPHAWTRKLLGATR